MGAMPWEHEAPWDPDPAVSLRALQAQFLADNYDLEKHLHDCLASYRQAVETTKAEGDPYELLDFYQGQLESLERMLSMPIPADAQERIELLRKAEAGSGQGIGNVLDVQGISSKRAICVAQPLDHAEMARLVGTQRPTLVEARVAADRIYLNRAECVCFPFYDADSGEPVGWYFVGYTID
jgi:hypothetical protein